MANDINRVILIGRLTRDPEYKLVSNSAVVNFSLANNRTYVSNNEKKEETNFFDCVAWGKLADIMKQYTKKGKQILVEGRLQQQTWDAPDGKKMSKIRIFVETMQLLGSAGGTGSGDSYQSIPEEVPPADIDSYSSVPKQPNMNIDEDDIF